MAAGFQQSSGGGNYNNTSNHLYSQQMAAAQSPFLDYQKFLEDEKRK
jgi:hypothetical protein